MAIASLIPLLSPKKQYFHPSSVSLQFRFPSPYRDGKKINFPSIDEKLLFSDGVTEAYKGDERDKPLSPRAVNEPKKQRAE